MFIPLLTACTSLPLAVTLPPLQYDRPASGVEVLRVPWDKAHKMCLGQHPGYGEGRALACAKDFGPLGWTIIMPKKGMLSAEDDAYLLRHEMAHVNGWPRHYLNLYHTPEKAVSFLIAGEAFRRMPRGAVYPTPPDDQVFAPAAVGFHRNAALLCADDTYMQARPTDWRPLPAPVRPRHIVGVGDTPFYTYEGTGVVDLRLGGREAVLRIYPDLERLRYALEGSPDRPLTRLHDNEHAFRLGMAGWEAARVERRIRDRWIAVPGTAGDFRPYPGAYRLIR